MRERPEFNAWPWRTLTRADSANYMSIGVVNELPPCFGGGEGKAATERRKAPPSQGRTYLLKSGGRKNLPLPYDLLEAT